MTALLAELPLSRAVAVAAQVTGLRKRALYGLALLMEARQADEKS